MSARITSGLLPAQPKRGKGVRRLNRWPVYIAGGALVVVFLVIAYTYQQRAAKQRLATAEAEAQQTQGAASHAKDVVSVPVGGETKRPPPPPPGPPERVPATRPVETVQTVDMAEQARRAAWVAYYQKLAAEEQAKADAEGKAFSPIAAWT